MSVINTTNLFNETEFNANDLQIQFNGRMNIMALNHFHHLLRL